MATEQQQEYWIVSYWKDAGASIPWAVVEEEFKYKEDAELRAAKIADYYMPIVISSNYRNKK